MRSGRHVPYLLIAPSLIFLTVLFLVPLGQTIALAFQADGGWSTANFSRMANDLNFSDAAATRSKSWSSWCRCSSALRWVWR